MTAPHAAMRNLDKRNAWPILCKENAMSSIWRSILVFLALLVFTVVLGVIFFPGH